MVGAGVHWTLTDLVADMNGGKVDLLIILGGNPAYDAPVDLTFADALKNGKVPLRVHYGLYQNETAELCQWHVNEAHYLEAWGDARAYDGTVSIVQPLIAPLYDGKSAHELVAMLSGQPQTKGHEIVQAYWKAQHSGADFDTFWAAARRGPGIAPRLSEMSGGGGELRRGGDLHGDLGRVPGGWVRAERQILPRSQEH